MSLSHLKIQRNSEGLLAALMLNLKAFLKDPNISTDTRKIMLFIEVQSFITGLITPEIILNKIHLLKPKINKQNHKKSKVGLRIHKGEVNSYCVFIKHTILCMI